MAANPDTLNDVRVLDRERWLDGPPHELFKELRASCPVHWTSEIVEFPTEKGFWSVTRPEDIAAVSRDWATYSSEVGGVTAISESIFPMELRGRCSSGWIRPSTTASSSSSRRASRPSASPSTRTRSA